MWHKEAKIRARKMGMQEPLHHQTPDFGDMKDDGYRESQEADPMQEMDRHRVERWRSNIIDSQTLYSWRCRPGTGYGRSGHCIKFTAKQR
jgi:hypothetical protein